MEVLHSGQAGF